MTKKALIATAALMLLAAAPAAAQGLLAKGSGAEQKGLTDLAEDYYRQAADTSATARLRMGILQEEELLKACYACTTADEIYDLMAERIGD